MKVQYGWLELPSVEVRSMRRRERSLKAALKRGMGQGLSLAIILQQCNFFWLTFDLAQKGTQPMKCYTSRRSHHFMKPEVDC